MRTIESANRFHANINSNINDRGFTLFEIMISIVIIAILSGMALTGMSSLMHRQRYTDTADRVRIMVQQARNRSQTQIDTAKTFGVYFSIGAMNPEVTLFQDAEPSNGQLDGSDTIFEKLKIDLHDLSISLKKNADVACNVSGSIMFMPKSTAAVLYCDNDAAQVFTLKINLQSAQIESLVRTYLINRESGTLQ